MTTLEIMRAVLADVEEAVKHTPSPWPLSCLASARKGLQTLVMDEEAKQAAEQRAREIDTIVSRPNRPPHSVIELEQTAATVARVNRPNVYEKI